MSSNPNLPPDEPVPTASVSQTGTTPQTGEASQNTAQVLQPGVPPAPKPSTLKKVFWGREGLRAGWSALIFILIFGALLATPILVILKFVPSAHRARDVQVIPLKLGIINEGLGVCAVLLATGIMAKIERRGRNYGYGGAHKFKHFLRGLTSGLALIALLVLILSKSGLLVIEGRLIFGGADVARYGLLWLGAFCLVGVFEESVMRGFLLYTLTRGFGAIYRRVFKTRHSAGLAFWTAASVLSIIFFLGHKGNPGESPVGLLAVFLAGMFFCYSIWRSGAIWWAIGMHAAWDWGQSFLFGVADSGLMAEHRLLATHPQGSALLSGGTTGPEGSILVLGVLAVGTLIVRFTLPQGHYYEALPMTNPAETNPSPTTANASA